MWVRNTLGAFWLCLSACSFIDDFSRFQAGDADAAVDAGPDEDAGGISDADVQGEDAGDLTDGEARDSEADVDSVSPPGSDEPCADETDGTPCGDQDGRICLKGYCRTSRCGDGYTDSARGEECDDANLARGDGCEPASCRFSCEKHADCDNHYPCDGEERCTEAHVCERDNVPATGAECKRDAMTSGLCNENGYCVPPGCGDGVRDMSTEACDPAEVPKPPGCREDCTEGCTQDADCSDGDACNGSETCDVSRGECRPGSDLSCRDGDPCTVDDVCDAQKGCVYPLLDADGDLVSEATCAPGSAHQGDDCDGTNPAVYPGAPEYCDGIDNDCDGQKDEDATSALCYPDRDRDGYPSQDGPLSACTCPAGTRPERPDGLWDCWDEPSAGGSDVHPKQDAYFVSGYERPCSAASGTCLSFDYDCDGQETALYPAGSGSCGLLGLICTGDGYNGAAPACGASGSYVVCAGGGLLSCGGTTEQRREACR